MEQNIQEQTSGHHRYSMRCVSGATGQVSGIKTCVLCQGRKDTPLSAADIASLASLAQEQSAHVQGVYHIASSLSHYGKVDSLVTAGAMDDFVNYVYQLEREEAQKYFAELEKALQGNMSHEFAVHFVREEQDWDVILASMQKLYAKIIICSFL